MADLLVQISEGEDGVFSNAVVMVTGFPGDSDGEASACNAGDLGSITYPYQEGTEIAFVLIPQISYKTCERQNRKAVRKIYENFVITVE